MLCYDRSPAIPVSSQQAGAGAVDPAISAREHHTAGRAVLRVRRAVHCHGGARAREGILAERFQRAAGQAAVPDRQLTEGNGGIL